LKCHFHSFDFLRYGSSMILDAAEFVQLRRSDSSAEQARATNEGAEDQVWRDVIASHPDLKIWVARNKTVSLPILRTLATDPDPKVRREVAGKRKLDQPLFVALAADPDEGVRFAILNNGKCPAHIRAALEERL
jgi:hypothetical protein